MTPFLATHRRVPKQQGGGPNESALDTLPRQLIDCHVEEEDRGKFKINSDVDRFTYLGRVMSKDGYCSIDIKNRLRMAWGAFKKNWKSKGINIKITATKNHTTVIINCIYRTPGSNLDIYCGKKIEHILRDVKAFKTIFLCGDLNFDLLKHEHHSNTKNFLDLMYNLGLYLLIEKPTRITNISATIIANQRARPIMCSLSSDDKQ